MIALSLILKLHYYVCGGAATLSGTSGFTSVVIFKRSSTTFCPVLSPVAFIAFTCSSAFLAASSSAFLFPLECYVNDSALVTLSTPDGMRWVLEYLLFKLLELFLFLLAIVIYLFLSFAASVSHALCPVCAREVRGRDGCPGNGEQERTFSGCRMLILDGFRIVL